jgi:regulator of protease activity HflC (stomatin/prohibitin superfamily)
VSEANESTPEEARPDPVDQAGRGLADALQRGFWLLRLLFVGLLAAFLLSGIFTVDADEVAVRTAFGRITGDAALTSEGGPYFRLPRPVGGVITVPTTERTLRLDRSFVFPFDDPRERNLTEEQRAARDTLAELQPIPGQPGEGGALLTGDRGIVYARYSVTYRVADAVAFVRGVAGPTDPARFVDLTDDAAGEELLFERADRMVRTAIEAAVVRDVSGRSVDELRRNLPASGVATEQTVAGMAQAALDDVDAGIDIVSVTRPEFTVPPQLGLRERFAALTAAVSQRQELVDRGQAQRRARLTQVAGEGAEALLAAVEAYETADARQVAALDEGEVVPEESAALLDAADEAISRLLEAEEVAAVLRDLATSARPVDAELADRLIAQAAANEGRRVGGTAAGRVRDADARAATLVDDAEADARDARALAADYARDREGLRQRLFFSTLATILARPDVRVEAVTGTRVVLSVSPDREADQQDERRRFNTNGGGQ